MLLLANELYVCIALLCLACEADIACLVYRRPASHRECVQVVLGKERPNFDDLLLRCDCSQAEEIELSFQSPTGYILQESEAAALAYCWNVNLHGRLQILP